MVERGAPLPRRIDPDAIIEAIFELRFDMVSPLPEILFGRLSEIPEWKGFSQKKLPAYEIPAAFRDSDPNLRYQPVLELAGVGAPISIRVGAHVISFHHMVPYPGWDTFSNALNIAVDGLFDKAEGLAVRRLGLRYINALNFARHGIGSIADLDVAIVASQLPLTRRLNLNFTQDVEHDKQCTVRLATREFVQGSVFPDDALLVDVDVFTTDEFLADSRVAVKKWAAEARAAKNEAFFGLLTRETVLRLGVD